MNKIELKPQYKEIQKQLYEVHKSNTTTPTSETVDLIKELISHMVAEGLQLYHGGE